MTSINGTNISPRLISTLQRADHLWRPLASLSFALQWKLNGSRAWAFHLVNILLHGVASALVAALAWRLAGNRAAWIAGLLFAAHPIHVEDVAYLVGRCETMAAVGVLAALVLLIRPPEKPMTYGRVAAIFGCFLMAIFSKEQGLLLPLMMGAWVMLTRLRWLPNEAVAMAHVSDVSDLKPATLDYARRGEPLANEAGRGPRGALLLLMLWSMVAYILYREHILSWLWDIKYLDWSLNPLILTHGAARFLIPVVALGRYAALLVFPWRLSPGYGGSVFTSFFPQSLPYFYLGLLTLLAYVIACIVTFRRRSMAALFCLICLGLTYFLVSNINQIVTIFGEPLMYLPSVFFLILFAQAVQQLPRAAGWWD